MHMCTCVRVRVPLCVCVRACVYACMFVCLYARMPVCVHACHISHALSALMSPSVQHESIALTVEDTF